ncbi:MAG: M20/M25/M40 family metallo-hydrolase [Candidatus Eisenbacteria bacterium]|uniref:M20/M25/M40 family metallo-hydrolase n=1 Tax=Eiseniibacteriota bacterium TaxID=2212470 RepID=A0A849SM92_UNCEI|nr:M20/M25/M40 family metallo-hydrolase [Candidatus Eisenbacteria bacterium]
MTDFARVDAELESGMERSLEELARLVAQPSVAAQKLGLEPCAGQVAGMFRQRGFEAEIHATSGAPIVVARRDGRTARRLLFYNHYDVQPAEPLELWESPPFTLTRRGQFAFGRGISDDKGHLTARLLALDALLAAGGELPCGITFIVEGEEEVSSPNLPGFVRSHRELLAADACVWEFGSVDHREVPMQYCGLRGICYVELSVATAAIDVHSGVGGSILANAAWRLTWALASLKDVDERIRIPGFHDDVRQPTPQDLVSMQALPEVADEYRRRFGVTSFLHGLTGGTDLRVAEVFQPTCTICGLTSGYQGPGSKTVLPARASAKVDFRLVPEQTPARVLECLRKHLDAEGFGDVKIEFLGGEAPARTDPEHPFVRLVVSTAAPVYGMPMQIVPMIGGSGPNHVFVHDLGLPVATAGLGYPDTRAHAPNENIRLDLYLKHARHMVRLIAAFGSQ